jgi:hypothetical protein
MTLDALLSGLIREALQEELRGLGHVGLSSSNHNGCAVDARLRTFETAGSFRFNVPGDARPVQFAGRTGAGRNTWSGQALDGLLALAGGASL